MLRRGFRGTRPLLSPEQEGELADWVRQGPDLAKHGVVRCRQDCHMRGIKARFARRGVDSSQRLGRHRWAVERTHA